MCVAATLEMTKQEGATTVIAYCLISGVLYRDTESGCGGGAAGDSIAVLRALLELNISETTLLMVVDPEAARACIAAGIGATVTLLDEDDKLGVSFQGDPAAGLPRCSPSVSSGRANSSRINSRMPRPVTARARPDISQP